LVTVIFSYHGATALVGQDLLIVKDSWSQAVRHITFHSTPPDEWSARRRDLYLTTHNIHKTDIHYPAGF